MPRTERGSRTRAEIVAAAGQLFVERGYAKANLADVVERAGVTKGAFYFHFSSKAQLAHEVVSTYRTWLQDLQTAVAASEPEPLLRPACVLLPVARSFHDSPITRATTRLLEESNQLDLEPLLKLHVPWWTDVLEQAAERGQLRDGRDRPAFAWTLNAAFYGTISNSYADCRWQYLPERVLDMLRFVLLPAVTPAAAGLLEAQLAGLQAEARVAAGGSSDR